MRKNKKNNQENTVVITPLNRNGQASAETKRKNINSLIKSKKEFIDIVDNVSLKEFIETFKIRSSGKINENTPYLVYSLKSIKILEELNDLFTLNGINSRNLYKNRMSIEISNKVPLEDINRIRIIKENDFRTIYEQREVLVNAIERKLKPELINFLPVPKVQENIARSSQNVDGSIANIELTWYYKNLLNWKLDLHETIYFDHEKFTIYDSKVAKNLPVNTSTIFYDEKLFPTEVVVKKAPSTASFREILLDIRIIHEYEEAMKLYLTMKAYALTWATKKHDKEFKTIVYSTMRDLVRYLATTFKASVEEFANKHGRMLVEKVPSFNKLISRMMNCSKEIVNLINELKGVSPELSVVQIEKIICLLKEVDFSLFDLHSNVTSVNEIVSLIFNINEEEDDEIDFDETELVKAIYFIKKLINDFLGYLQVFETYWTPNQQTLISFNPENNKWLFTKSISLKQEFKKIPSGINDLYKNIFFKFAAITEKDRDELIAKHGISYLCDIVPIYYNTLVDSINLFKSYLINLEILLKNNLDLSRQLRLDRDSSHLADKFFENYLDTVKLLKTSINNILKNSYIISTPTISVSKDDLMRFKMFADENLNIAKQFVDTNILKELVDLNSESLIKVQLKAVQETCNNITSLVNFIQNASIGMCITINTMIATQDLYAKVKKTEEFIEGDSTMDLLRTCKKINTVDKIKVRYSSNVGTINQFNWYESDRVFDSRVKGVIEEKILDFYSHLDKAAANFDVEKDPAQSRMFFEKWWNVYLTEQGIAKDLEQLARLTDDIANQEYLNFIFAKVRADKFYRNLALDFEDENLYEGMLNAKLGVFHVYSAKSKIFKALLSHRRRAQWAFQKLGDAFSTPEYFLLLKGWIEEWYANTFRLIDRVYEVAADSTDPKVHKIVELLNIHDRILSMNEIEKFKYFKDEVPKTIFAGFGPKEINKFGLTSDIVPVKEVKYIQDSIADNLDKTKEIFDQQFTKTYKKAPTKKQLEGGSIIYTDRIPTESVHWPKIKITNFIWDDLVEKQLEAIREAQLRNEEQPDIISEEIIEEIFQEVEAEVVEEIVEEAIQEIPQLETSEQIVEEVVEQVVEQVIEQQEQPEVVAEEPVEVIPEEEFAECTREIEYTFRPNIYAFPEEWLQHEEPKQQQVYLDNNPTITTYELTEPVEEQPVVVEEVAELTPVEEVIEEAIAEEIAEEVIENVEAEVVEEIIADPQVYVFLNQHPITTHYCFSYDEFPEEIDSQSRERYVLVKLEEQPTEEVVEEEIIEEAIPEVISEPTIQEPKEVEIDEEPIQYNFENDYIEDEIIEEPIIEDEVIEELVEEAITEEIIEDVIAEEIAEEIVDEIAEEVIEDDFEKEYVYADETPLTDAELMFVEKQEQFEIEYVYAEDKLLTDEEMMFNVEIVEWDGIEAQEEVVDTVIDESAPYADPIRETYEEIVEEVIEEPTEEVVEEEIIEEQPVEEIIDELVEETIAEEITEEVIEDAIEEETIAEEVIEEVIEDDFEKEYVEADETPLTDEELIVTEVEEQPEIEYVYAEDKLLTDEEMMFNVEIIEAEQVEEPTEEVVNTVIDESAPYADEITEVYDEPVEEIIEELAEEEITEEIIEDEIEEIIAEEAIIEQVEDTINEEETEITEEVIEEPTEEVEIIEVQDTNEDEVVEEEIIEEQPIEELVEEVIDESAPYADEIQEVEDEITEEVIEEPTKEIIEEEQTLYSNDSEEELVEETAEEIIEDELEETIEDIVNEEILDEVVEEVTEEETQEEIAEEAVIEEEVDSEEDDFVDYEEELQKEFSDLSIYNDNEEAIEDEIVEDEIAEEVAEDLVEETEEPIEEVIEDIVNEEILDEVVEEVTEESEEELTYDEIKDEIENFEEEITAEAAEELVEEINNEEIIEEELVDEVEEAIEDEIVEDVITEEVAEDLVEETEEPIEEVIEDIVNEEILDEVVEEVTEEETQPEVLANSAKVTTFELADPTADEASLDWTTLDAESHTIKVEEPVFVKVFKINE